MYQGSPSDHLISQYIRQATSDGKRGVESWRVLHRELRKEALTMGNIKILYDVNVVGVGQTKNYGYVVTNSGRQI